MTFACPKCGQHLALETLYGGQVVKCPVCAQEMAVPDTAAGVGALYGAAFLYTGNVWVAAGAHALANFASAAVWKSRNGSGLAGGGGGGGGAGGGAGTTS